MKKHLHTLRVAYENWFFDDRFYGLTELLKKYDTGITDIALFTAIVHTPLTVKENRRRADIITDRIKYLKSEGYYAGINILATIGHHHEDLDNMLKGPYQMMVGADGAVSPATFCMNDETFLSGYVAVIYDMYARTGADFIWVDDDVRYGHMPIGNGCFCDLCIDKFNSENNYSFDRPGLIAELENGDVEFRRKWLRQNRETLSRLLSVAGKAVRKVDENIMLGFMTGERYIESYDFLAFSEALSDGRKYEIMWRPGGGAYNDFSFDYIVAKSEQIGRQNAYLPPYVTINHSEIENFPYNLINKTPKSTAVEAAINMTVGCTGGAFNILPSETLEPIENIAPHLKAIADIKAFYRTLQEVTAGLSPAGIHTGWRIDDQAAVPLVSGDGGSLASYCRTRNITLTGDGRQCVTLFNTSNDDIGDLSIMIKTAKCTADVYMMPVEKYSLECGEKTDEGYKCYTISNLKPYEMAVIVT